MKLCPIAWKASGYKVIAVLMECFAVLFAFVILSGAPAGVWACWIALLLAPLWLWLYWRFDREYGIALEVTASGITMTKRGQAFFFVAWDAVQTMQICFGVRDISRSRYGNDCCHVCISNDLIADTAHFDKRSSLNWLQVCPKPEEAWVIYCNRGTQAECRKLMAELQRLRASAAGKETDPS